MKPSYLLAALIIGASASAQVPFERAYVVPSGAVIQDGVVAPDGSLLFTYEMNDDLHLMKASPSGQLLWTRRFSYAANDGLYGRSLAAAHGVYLLGGFSIGSGTASRDGLLLVTDTAGSLQANIRVDRNGASNAVHAITAVADGFILAGRAENGANGYEMYMMHADMTGTIDRANTYGSDDWDWSYQAEPLADGGYAVVGYGDGLGGTPPDAYVVRTDSVGNVLWSRAIESGSADEGYCVAEDGLGALYIGGRTLGMGTIYPKGFITKLNASGGHEWTKVLNNSYDVVALHADPVSGITALAVAEDIVGGPGNYDVLLAKLDANGNELWNHAYGTAGDEYAVALVPHPGGGFLITASANGFGTGQYIYAIVTDAFGVASCHDTPVALNWVSWTPSVLVHNSITGTGFQTYNYPATPSFISLTQQPICTSVGLTETDPVPFRTVPNPASQQVVLQAGSHDPGRSVFVRDMQGRLLHQQRATETSTAISLEGFAAGRYLVEVRSGDGQRHNSILVVAP